MQTSDGVPWSLISRYVVQIQVDSHFDLVSWLLGLEATEPVSEPVRIFTGNSNGS